MLAPQRFSDSLCWTFLVMMEIGLLMGFQSIEIDFGGFVHGDDPLGVPSFGIVVAWVFGVGFGDLDDLSWLSI